MERQQGYLPDWVCGCDEAGRGPLAGPVVAAAVILAPDHGLAGLADSKALSPKRREALYAAIAAKAIAWAVAEASVAEIEHLNILQASLLAMQRAIMQLHPLPAKVWIDGNQLPQVPMVAEAVIQGDRLVPAISAASIMAKVTRDRLMQDYHQQWPHYQFGRHKGYPTAVHLQALQQYGVSPIHRRTFAPVKQYLSAQFIKLPCRKPEES